MRVNVLQAAISLGLQSDPRGAAQHPARVELEVCTRREDAERFIGEVRRRRSRGGRETEVGARGGWTELAEQRGSIVQAAILGYEVAHQE